MMWRLYIFCWPIKTEMEKMYEFNLKIYPKDSGLLGSQVGGHAPSSWNDEESQKPPIPPASMQTVKPRI